MDGEMEKLEHAIAVKAFLVHNGRVLLLKRRPNDVHSAGKWDIPGGRLDPGEDPFEGLKREAREEAGIEINIHAPLDVHHFTRDDGQKITMIIFLCTTENENVSLSEEHTEFNWASVMAVDDMFPGWVQPIVKHYRKHFA